MNSSHGTKTLAWNGKFRS